MKRRDVLKAGMVAAGGLVLPRSAARAGTEAPAGELKVALVGVGTQGRELIRAALIDPGIRFLAVSDIWPYARRYGEAYLKGYGHEVNTYADYREMLDKEKGLDAVIVASPDCVHAEQATACLKAGLHVYCETMMSSTLEGARSMVRAMGETGKLLQIGYQRRSNPRYLHVYSRLLQEAKLLGRPTDVNTFWALTLAPDRGWPRRQDIPDDVLRQHGYASMQEFRNWRWYRGFSAGLFGNLGACQIDVACWFLGTTPSRVLAAGVLPKTDEKDRWPDNVTAIVDFETPGGAVQTACQVLTTTRGDGSGSHEDFLGTKGSIRVSQNPKWTAVFRDPNAPPWDQWVRNGYLAEVEKERARRSERTQSDVSETGEVARYEVPVVLDKPPCYPHLANFFEAVRGRAAPNCPADVALAAEVVVHKVTEAVQSGRSVALGKEDFAGCAGQA